ncbi:MAG: KH domain-containing protein [Alicyclobacillaceae bacterium]|nr:KH domain-containing protein [Alicyclobacillaceae bacterium]
MKELLEFLAKSLVDHPDSVSVAEEHKGDLTVYRVTVDPADVGKVIGKQGRIAKAIRSVVGAAAHRENRHVVVDIES